MRLTSISAALACVLFVTAVANSAPVISFTGGTPTTDFPNRTLGYNFFTGANAFPLSSLGIWDQGQDGLAQSHQVGIWNSVGDTLLASAIIPAGTAAILDGQFRYVPITPILLPANSEFLAGAFTGSATDAVIRFTTATTVPGITLGSTRFDTQMNGIFTAPTGTQGTTFDSGYFGVNFNGEVPEPCTIFLVILGCIPVLCRRQRS